jgi:phosphate transport system protein
MPAHFEQELGALKQKLLAMATHAQSAIKRAMTALLERDAKLARQTIEDDSILDRFEVEVDDLSIHLLAKAPLASDLRFIMIAMKISHDLERVGDQATKIARRADDLSQDAEFQVDVGIRQMAGLALTMLKDAVESFVDHDPAKARAIIPRDRELDALNKQTYQLLVSYLTRNPDTVAYSLHQIMIAKALERIADHATNIAEEVVYLYEGHDIRHAQAPPAAASMNG